MEKALSAHHLTIKLKRERLAPIICFFLCACSTTHVQDPKHTWSPAVEGVAQRYNKGFNRDVLKQSASEESKGDIVALVFLGIPAGIVDLISFPFHAAGHLFVHGPGSSIHGPPTVAPSPTGGEVDQEVDSPPAPKTKVDPNAFAIVIGIEQYRSVPRVEFAVRDAESMRNYLVRAMGFDGRNVILLRNEQATKADLEKYLGTWLGNRVTKQSRVFVYYAGHGAPDPVSGDGFLMPYEADPNYTQDTAFPVKRLYAHLAKLPAKDIFVALDACFSGAGGRSLIAQGFRPLVQVRAPDLLGDNTVAMTAASGSQISTSHSTGKHGLMTYFLLRGLKGEADGNADGLITTRELFSYLRPNVERAARLQNVEQTPTIIPPLESLGTRLDSVWLENER